MNSRFLFGSPIPIARVSARLLDELAAETDRKLAAEKETAPPPK